MIYKIYNNILYILYPNSISQILNFVMRTPLNGPVNSRPKKNGRKNGNSDIFAGLCYY